MDSIPPDIYERAKELALAIVNASSAGDDALHDSLCQSLRAYHDEMAAAGRSHPFLTETSADFTSDAVEAVRLYQLSLAQSHDLPHEPTHTKLLCLAEKLIEMGRIEQAEACIRDGRAEAERRNDEQHIAEADRLLRQLEK